MQGIWTTTEFILLPGDLHVKRLVCMYKSGASDLKPLTMLAGIQSQFRFTFPWDNPLALMTKVCNIFSKMSQLLALCHLLAGTSGLWNIYLFFRFDYPI